MVTDVVILAAGKGTRMHSTLPKPLHSILGKPIIQYVLDSVVPLVDNDPVLVIGYGADQIREVLGENLRYVEQNELLGTGHAVKQAKPLLSGAELILVTYGDMPLIRSETLQELISTQKSNPGPMTLLTVQDKDPRGFGRILRNEEGNIQKIVEETNATADQLKITELNAGMYCFQAEWLWKNLEDLKLSPKGEYYLTDLVGMAVDQRLEIETVSALDPQELIGINTRVHLAEAGKVLRQRINEGWMLAGVSLVDPENVYIEPDVKIGPDTIILPNTYLQGESILGNNCRIGPDTKIYNSQIGNSCEIEFSVVEESIVEDGVDIGPFSHLRKGTHLGPGVHIGNFGEIKDSYLGEGTKVGHFAYLGDAQIGKNVNIGAGTITCNYDGKKKHQTVIKDGVFIGSDSMLVAPLVLGENSVTGAGSVVNKDVPPDTVVVGIPARKIAKRKKK